MTEQPYLLIAPPGWCPRPRGRAAGTLKNVRNPERTKHIQSCIGSDSGRLWIIIFSSTRLKEREANKKSECWLKCTENLYFCHSNKALKVIVDSLNLMCSERSCPAPMLLVVTECPCSSGEEPSTCEGPDGPSACCLNLKAASRSR